MKLELTLPPSANNLYPTGKNGRRFKSKEYKSWQAINGWVVRNTWNTGETIKKPVRVIITIKGGRGFNEEVRDVANCEKAVTDLLVTCGVLKGDAAKYVRESRQVYVPPEGDEKATCHVEIFPIGLPIDSFCKR